MNETAIYGAVFTALFGLIGAVYAAVNARQARAETAIARAETSIARIGERVGMSESEIAKLRSQNERQERDVIALQATNRDQGEQIGRLMERMKAREDAHAAHREDMRENFASQQSRLERIETKLDQLATAIRNKPSGSYTFQENPKKTT